MDSYNFGFKDDLEDEEADEEKIIYNSKDGMIFLIDCNESMFSDDEENFFTTCIQCVQSTLKNKIIQNNRDLVGVVFFGTEKTKNTDNFEHIYIYQDLARPNAERIIKIENMLTDDWKTFYEDYGHNSSYQMSDVFWLCSLLFSKCTEKLGFQRILLFTNKDEPHTDKTELVHCRTRANDLNKTGISLELLPLQPPNQTFDVSKFYKNILSIIHGDEIEQLPDTTEKLEGLLERVRCKERQKRVLRRLPLRIGDGIEATVGLFRLKQRCQKPPSVRLYKRDNSEVKSNRQFYLQDTGETLMPQDIKYSKTYGNRTATFEKEEVTKIRMFGEPGFKLLGFQQQKDVRTHYHIKPTHFIYPEEKSTSGSTCFFSALLDRCLQRGVVPICEYISSKTSAPEFVALLPQKETFENEIQSMPPGFHVLYLPHAEDFRELNVAPTTKAQDGQIDLAKKLIKSLKIKYNFTHFDNPPLKYHWMNIENRVLDKESAEEFVDNTLPDTKAMDKKGGEAIKNFKEAVFPEDYNPDNKKKRAGGGDTAKKTDSSKHPLTDKDLKVYWMDQKLEQLKVADLDRLMKENGIKCSTKKKKDLIDAIKSHYGDSNT
ncbi:X-ray repair cross-complementing protein 5-like [Octopus vulgaris]|uniref:DNA helicase n=1 Tax=Octopus vulgaris TaxID=6645 RepID=A0AA36F5K5_OCTVU|nr:X-ray repair cross-complementing protein 5-like [Octopus vulgaris]